DVSSLQRFIKRRKQHRDIQSAAFLNGSLSADTSAVGFLNLDTGLHFEIVNNGIDFSLQRIRRQKRDSGLCAGGDGNTKLQGDGNAWNYVLHGDLLEAAHRSYSLPFCHVNFRLVRTGV